MKRVAIAAAAVIGLLIVWQVFSASPRDDGSYLGYVEGDLLYIGPIEGERLGGLSVEVGAQVEAGAPLFAMETPLLDAQHKEATARNAQMEAQLENLKAALNRPQQVAVLQAAVTRAEAELKLSQLTFERQKKLYAQRDVAKATLDNAQMALSRDEAALAEAKRQVDAALLTGRSQEIEGAEASLRQAHAQLGQLDIRIARQKVFAPAAGVVQDVFFRTGEMVTAGQPVLSLLPPENRKARFYVPQARLSTISSRASFSSRGVRNSRRLSFSAIRSARNWCSRSRRGWKAPRANCRWACRCAFTSWTPRNERASQRDRH